MSAINDFKRLLEEAATAQKKTSESIVKPKTDSSPSITEETVVEKTARYLSGSKTVSENTESQRWNDPLRRETNATDSNSRIKLCDFFASSKIY